MNSILSSVSSQITNNIFSKIDSKNQGYIEKSDLTSAFSKVNDNSETADAEALFSSIDTDSDGKITKSELSTKIESLLGQLNGSMESGRMRPPPPPSGPRPDDAGVTKEQATEIAASTDDEKLSSIMTEIAENFEAADTNQDGKVSMEESRSYHEANKTSEATTSADSNANELYMLQMRMAQLIEAYGLGSTSEESSSGLYATV